MFIAKAVGGLIELNCSVFWEFQKLQENIGEDQDYGNYY